MRSQYGFIHFHPLLFIHAVFVASMAFAPVILATHISVEWGMITLDSFSCGIRQRSLLLLVEMSEQAGSLFVSS